MGKRLVSLLIILCICTVAMPNTVFAVDVQEFESATNSVTYSSKSGKADVHFNVINVYQQGQFSDVKKSQWYSKTVASAFELGLMKGDSNGKFNPSGNVTLAEAITMASRLHSINATGTENFIQSGQWWQVYLDYALQKGIIDKSYYNSDVTKKATRAQFAEIFANSLPDENLYAINDIPDNFVPDVPTTASYAGGVYKLYRAGILTGNSANGRFNPKNSITRAEAATIISRMAESNNRVVRPENTSNSGQDSSNGVAQEDKTSNQHLVTSDFTNPRNFTFKENEEIEDLVYSMPSQKYNPRLAHFLAVMARGAYYSVRDEQTENFKELGFQDGDIIIETEHDPKVRYTIGKKTLKDGTSFVLIVIRGSGNPFDQNDDGAWTDINFRLGKGALIEGNGWHEGFNDAADIVYREVKSLLGSIKTDKVTYVITGHSMGAAAGNLLAMQLYNAGVPTDLVYDYNFACPNVAVGSGNISDWNNQGIHNNIINVGNWCDQVTHMPGLASETITALLGNSIKWKRYGQSYWFDNGWQISPLEAHDMVAYIDYLKAEKNESNFRESEFAY